MYREEILIYAGAHCRYCRRVKRLLKRKGYAFEEVDIDEGMRARLIETTRRKTVPLIFLGGRVLGGFDNIKALDRSKSADLVGSRYSFRYGPGAVGGYTVIARYPTHEDHLGNNSPKRSFLVVR